MKKTTTANFNNNQQEKIMTAAHKLLAMFQSGEFPEMAKRSILMKAYNSSAPSANWSIGNIITMLLAGTEDARGFKQWEKAGRKVKKGAKALYILGPCTHSKTVQDKETGEEKKEFYISGFRQIPVFAVENTEGPALPQSELNPPEPPPLFEVAERYGIKVKYASFNGRALGSCAVDGSRITLSAHDADVWFHELAHAVDAKLAKGGRLKGGQDAEQETVAELTSGVLCQLYGVEGYECQAWQYIKRYNGNSPENAIKQIYNLLGRVEAIIMDILQIAEKAPSSEESEAA